MKTCTKCGVEKELDAFPRDARFTCGRRPDCKACKKRSEKAWLSRHPGYKPQSQVQWTKDNVPRIRELQRQWTSRNLHKAAAKTRKRKADSKNRPCDCCQTEDAKVNFILTYALARRLRMHVDHVRPLSKGGKHCLHNLQLLIPVDNLRKGAKWQEAA